MKLHDIVFLAAIGGFLMLHGVRFIVGKVAERRQKADNLEAELHLAKVTGTLPRIVL